MNFKLLDFKIFSSNFGQNKPSTHTQGFHTDMHSSTSTRPTERKRHRVYEETQEQSVKPLQREQLPKGSQQESQEGSPQAKHNK